MTPKFKLGDLVENKETKKYFIVGRIVINSCGIYYSGEGLVYIEGSLQLKKTKVKKYRYAYINADNKTIFTTKLTYRNDEEFLSMIGSAPEKFQRLDFTEIEAEE